MSREHRIRRVRGVGIAGVCAVALIVPSAGLGAGPGKCFSSQLLLKNVSFQGATGHRYWEMAFKNVSGTCTMRGYPHVTLLDHGHVIHTSISHWQLVHVKTVTLAMNKRAFFVLKYADGGFCPGMSFNANRFKFAPPHTHAPFTFNPVPKNHGVPSICKGSVSVTAVSAKKI